MASLRARSRASSWRRLRRADSVSRRLAAALPLMALTVALALPGGGLSARPAAAANILPTLPISPCIAGTLLCNGGVLTQPTPCVAGLLCAPLPVPTPCVVGDILCPCSVVGPANCPQEPSPKATPQPTPSNKKPTPRPSPRSTPSAAPRTAPIPVGNQPPSAIDGVPVPNALASLTVLGLRGGFTGATAHLLPWLVALELVALLILSGYYGARILVRGRIEER